jgi:predicted acetyltransferase
MIQFANEDTAPLVRRMWETCFGDTDEYMDIIFTYKYKDENTLIYFVDGEVVASLQMFPHTINFYKQEIPFAYLAGLCTLPKHRKKGYMALLISEAHKVAAERNIPLTILIPAEPRLYKFYNKYGYEQVFEKDKNPIPLKAILDNNTTNFDEAYRDFDELFRFRDFCVQKSKWDFEAIAAEYKLDGCPPKTNLSGMARIIDTWALLDLYAKDNLSKKFRIKISDGGSKGQPVTYSIDKGSVELVLDSYPRFDIEIDRRLLCRILFGYKTKEFGHTYPVYFEEHQTILNLMLE